MTEADFAGGGTVALPKLISTRSATARGTYRVTIIDAEGRTRQIGSLLKVF